MEQKRTGKIENGVTISVRLNMEAFCRLCEIAMRQNVTRGDVMRRGLSMVFAADKEEWKKQAKHRERTKEEVVESVTRLVKIFNDFDKSGRIARANLKQASAVNIVEILQGSGMPMEDIENIDGIEAILEDYDQFLYKTSIEETRGVYMRYIRRLVTEHNQRFNAERRKDIKDRERMAAGIIEWIQAFNIPMEDIEKIEGIGAVLAA
jgi:hypothetical protein